MLERRSVKLVVNFDVAAFRDMFHQEINKSLNINIDHLLSQSNFKEQVSQKQKKW